MSSKKRLSRIEQAQQEENILNSQVRLDGVGEDKVIQELLSDDFVKADNVDAMDIALALQELVRGQNSILGAMKGQGEAITKLQKRMDKMDKDAKRWEKDRAGFLESVQERSEKLKITDPEQKARLIARESKRVQQEIQNAVANRSVDDIQFGAWIESQPKVTVTSMGRPVTVNRAGVIQVEMEPEVIRIRNKSWTLTPGIPTDIPQPVADEFYARQKIRQETIERKRILDANKPIDNVIMAQKWNEISQKYGSTELMISDDRSE